jgi:thiamine biosynthesis lipoprotein
LAQCVGRYGSRPRQLGGFLIMALTETLPVTENCTQWTVWGTLARLVTTDPSSVVDAAEVVRVTLADVDEACSRFRPDSELRRACGAGGRTVQISPLLADLVRAGLRAAGDTDGDVDPTVGGALNGLGYDRDFDQIAGRRLAPNVAVYPVGDWRRIRLQGRELTVPIGMHVDLGATAKAWAADRCARQVAQICGVGVLVALGGDIATAGPAPEGGWRILVQDRPGEPHSTVTIPAGGAVATSSTISRQWHFGDQLMHHILDPRTGQPVRPVWRTASVAAFDCVRANTLSTAAMVRGHAAPGWLRQQGAPARLVAADGSVRVMGGWPEGDFQRRREATVWTTTQDDRRATERGDS